MGLFRKERHYHVEEVDTNGVERRLVPSDEPTKQYEEKQHLKSLEKEYHREHPTPRMVRKQERREQRQREKKAYRESFQKARMKRMSELGSRAGSKTWGDRMQSFGEGFNVPSGRRYSTKGNFNPIGVTFDTGMSPMKKPRVSKPRKKYTVVGGKAYPVAGTGKKRKGKSKKSKSKGRSGGGRDAFSHDFGSWGW